jgi:hypothetical protein
VVFEQEYHGVEGDSASCAELYALLSSLSGVPLKQGIAVTGALNRLWRGAAHRRRERKDRGLFPRLPGPGADRHARGC